MRYMRPFALESPRSSLARIYTRKSSMDDSSILNYTCALRISITGEGSERRMFPTRLASSAILSEMNLSTSARDCRRSYTVHSNDGQRVWAQCQIALACRRLWPERRMINRLLVGAVLVSLVPLCSLAQTHSGFPVDIAAGPWPQPVMADGRLRLLHELHLTNYAPLPIQLTGIDVLGDGTSALASYRGQALDKVVIPVEKLSRAESPSGIVTPEIGEGHSVVIFMDLSLESGARPPAELHHRFAFSVARQNKPTIERTLDGPVVAVVRQPTAVLRPPLRGSHWVALNALGSEDHRRSMNAVDGRVRIAQRFAIDWMRLGPDGRLFHGDTNSNANFYDYG